MVSPMVFKFLVVTYVAFKKSSLLVRTLDDVIYTVDTEGESYYVTSTLGDGELWRSLDELIGYSMIKLDRVLEISRVTRDGTDEPVKALWRN